MAALIPLAHLGHWGSWVLYTIPVIIVLASVVMTLIRERRDGAEDPIHSGELTISTACRTDRPLPPVSRGGEFRSPRSLPWRLQVEVSSIRRTINAA